MRGNNRKLFVEKCSYGDSSCFTRLANEIVSQGKTGNAALGLGVFDPLKVDKLSIDQKDGPVVLKIDLKNFNFGGLSDIKFTKVDGFKRNFEKAKVEFRFKFPRISIQGIYKHTSMHARMHACIHKCSFYHLINFNPRTLQDGRKSFGSSCCWQWKVQLDIL